MAAPSGMFCEHKRLRTSCPSCRPPPPPPREKPAPAARAAPKRAKSADETSEEKAPRATGPGKPLLPTRKPKSKGVTRREAERADAWWVKRE